MILNEISFDIETMGLDSNAAIVAVGMTRFNRKTGDYVTTTYYIKDPSGNIDIDTVRWWCDQEDEVRSKISTPQHGYIALTEQELCETITQVVDNNTKVWGNGSIFDISILESLFKRKSISVPWKFWNIRDVRTVVDMYDVDVVELSKSIDGYIKHECGIDSMLQAKIVIESNKMLNKEKYMEKDFEMIVDNILSVKNSPMVENFEIINVISSASDEKTLLEISYDMPLYGYSHKGVSTFNRVFSVEESSRLLALVNKTNIESKSEEDDIQEVIQHFRPNTFTKPAIYLDKYNTVNGVTLRMVINHTKKYAEIFASVCSGDSFSKKTGVLLTRLKDRKIAEASFTDETPTFSAFITSLGVAHDFEKFQNFIKDELGRAPMAADLWSYNATK